MASASALAEQFGSYVNLHRAVSQGLGSAQGLGLGQGLGPGQGQGQGVGQGQGLGQGQRQGRGLTEENDEENAAIGSALP